METCKRRLHQLEIGIIENSLVGKYNADGRGHVDDGPYQKPPSQARAGGRCSGLCLDIVVDLGMILIRAMDWHQRDAVVFIVLRHLEGYLQEEERKGGYIM